MKREFVTNKLGKEYVLYAGLLDEAHERGLMSISTDLRQVPGPDNGHCAIVYAMVTMGFPNGDEMPPKTFTGIGDASPENVSRAMQSALIRMAETRAKARALRDAINVGDMDLAEGDQAEHGERVQTQAPAAPDPLFELKRFYAGVLALAISESVPGLGEFSLPLQASEQTIKNMGAALKARIEEHRELRALAQPGASQAGQASLLPEPALAGR